MTAGTGALPRRRSARAFPLAGRTVLVTGGGRGIGRLMALGAARRGAGVVVWDLDAGRAASVVAEIEHDGGHAVLGVVDVTDPAAVEHAAAALRAGAIDVDVVINNAGIVTGRDLLDASDAQIRRTYEVNALALAWVTRAFLPGMVDRNSGKVVTIASAAGLVGVARQTDYSASKFAAVGFTESLRAELRRARTRVSTLLVCPYYIDTGMFDGVRTRVPALLPILREGRVAERVLDSIEDGRELLVMPPLVRLMPALRVLPVPAFDAIMDLFGVNATMEHFIGRAK